jgi:hypothetical protein
MLRIEVQNATVETRKGTIKNGDRSGQAYEIRQQEAWVHNGRAYPQRVVLSLAPDHAGYAAGFYTVAAESFIPGDFDKLELARYLTLTPEVSAVRKVG